MTTKQYVERDKNGRAKHLNNRNKSTIHFFDFKSTTSRRNSRTQKLKTRKNYLDVEKKRLQ